MDTCAGGLEVQPRIPCQPVEILRTVGDGGGRQHQFHSTLGTCRMKARTKSASTPSPPNSPKARDLENP